MEQGLQELLQPGLVLRQELTRGGLKLDTLSPEQRAAKVCGSGLKRLQEQVAALQVAATALGLHAQQCGEGLGWRVV
jgi:hypothetical protein